MKHIKIQIKRIMNPEVFIQHYSWIKECNFTEITPELVLSKCLTGEYIGFLGVLDDKIVGLVIVKEYTKMAFIVGCWCKNNLIHFLTEFFKLAKTSGFTSIRTSAYFSEKAYERLTGFKKLWTVYERIL